jgi:hypothetical protein
MEEFMKRIILLIVGVYIVGMFSACNSTKLADFFDKDTVEVSAKHVIEYMNSGDFDSVNAMVREDSKEILTSDVLSDAVDKTYGKAGTFLEYKDINIVGKKDKNMDYAIALVKAKYEKQSVLFTISFDSNMDVIGIYMK